MEQPLNIRPWGRYDILDTGHGFKVKRITVSPGQRLSYQRHARRDESWIIVAGKVRVTLDDAPMEMSEGQTVLIPASTKHRVQNIGETPAIFIEVQTGDYLEEDDIERFDDDYGRTT